jgi:methylglyoxal synthase
LKKLALIAHDNKKKDLIEWAEWNYKILVKNEIICTGTTGKRVEQALLNKIKRHNNGIQLSDLKVTKLLSGPLGGDAQIGALIAENKIDILFFFWDSLEPQAHDSDVKALLRLATLYNIPYACNRATADYIIASSLMVDKNYVPYQEDYSNYINR